VALLFLVLLRRPCSDSDMLQRFINCRIIKLIIIIIIIIIITTTMCGLYQNNIRRICSIYNALACRSSIADIKQTMWYHFVRLIPS